MKFETIFFKQYRPGFVAVGIPEELQTIAVCGILAATVAATE